MGTNYYSVKRGIESLGPDEFWERRRDLSDDVLHIGKSSGGWCFSLHIIPERGINDLRDWLEMFINPDRIIIDEYRVVIPFTQMISTITMRSRPDPVSWSEATLALNHAILGPNNLVRHQIGQYCKGHGEGTWDLITGEFS